MLLANMESLDHWNVSVALINDPDDFHMSCRAELWTETGRSHPLPSKCGGSIVYVCLCLPDDFYTNSQLSKHKWFTCEHHGFLEQTRRQPTCWVCVLTGPVSLTLLSSVLCWGLNFHRPQQKEKIFCCTELAPVFVKHWKPLSMVLLSHKLDGESPGRSHRYIFLFKSLMVVQSFRLRNSFFACTHAGRRLSSLTLRPPPV